MVIVGDAYVKSKYYHLNDWIKPTDELGNIITEDEDAEDPLEPFYNKTQQEIASRKALVKMLHQDKEIQMKKYFKDKHEEKVLRATQKFAKSEESSEDSKDEEVPTEKLQMATLGMTLFKYITFLNNRFEEKINEKGAQSGVHSIPEVILQEKEDIYDRYVNCYNRIYEAFEGLKAEKMKNKEKRASLIDRFESQSFGGY